MSTHITSQALPGLPFITPSEPRTLKRNAENTPQISIEVGAGDWHIGIETYAPAKDLADLVSQTSSAVTLPRAYKHSEPTMMNDEESSSRVSTADEDSDSSSVVSTIEEDSDSTNSNPLGHSKVMASKTDSVPPHVRTNADVTTAEPSDEVRLQCGPPPTQHAVALNTSQKMVGQVLNTNNSAAYGWCADPSHAAKGLATCALTMGICGVVTTMLSGSNAELMGLGIGLTSVSVVIFVIVIAINRLSRDEPA